MLNEFLEIGNFNQTIDTLLNNTFYGTNNSLVIPFHQQSIYHERHLIALSRYHGYLDPKFVKSINPFWLNFRPPSAAMHYTFAVIYLFIMTIGVFGNCLVIFMFLKCRSLRTAANTLVINLAISDFFMLAKTPFIIYNSINQGPALGDYACKIYGLIGGLTGTASIATLTAIAIDRYLVIVYPLNPLLSTAKRRSRFMVVIVWIYSLTFSLPPAFNIGLSKYVPEGYLTSCSFDYLDKSLQARVFMLIFFICAWCIPFSVITYCYINILKVVIAAKRIQSNKDKNKTEIRLAAIVLYVIILWFTAWSPYALVALLGISGNEHKITPFGSMIPALFCKTAACLDPYVYAITHPRFRMEFNRLFFKKDPIPKYQTSCSRTQKATIQMRHVQNENQFTNEMENTIIDCKFVAKADEIIGIKFEVSVNDKSSSGSCGKRSVILINENSRKIS